MRDHALVLDAFECVLLFCELQNNSVFSLRKLSFFLIICVAHRISGLQKHRQKKAKIIYDRMQTAAFDKNALL